MFIIRFWFDCCFELELKSSLILIESIFISRELPYKMYISFFLMGLYTWYLKGRGFTSQGRFFSLLLCLIRDVKPESITSGTGHRQKNTFKCKFPTSIYIISSRSCITLHCGILLEISICLARHLYFSDYFKMILSYNILFLGKFRGSFCRDSHEDQFKSFFWDFSIFFYFF